MINDKDFFEQYNSKIDSNMFLITSANVDKYLKVFQIFKLKDSKVFNLSGGERQRLNILIALISNPSILILDEISTGLDIRSQNNLINFIRDYVEKKINVQTYNL